jgi:hypothetical protein
MLYHLLSLKIKLLIAARHQRGGLPFLTRGNPEENTTDERKKHTACSI